MDTSGDFSIFRNFCDREKFDHMVDRLGNLDISFGELRYPLYMDIIDRHLSMECK